MSKKELRNKLINLYKQLANKHLDSTLNSKEITRVLMQFIHELLDLVE